MGDERHPGRYPTGKPTPVTDQWRLLAEARLKALDWTREQLAARMKPKPGSKSMVGRILAGNRAPHNSKFVEEISRILEIPTPAQMQNELAAKLDQLPSAARERILALVDWILATTR